MFCRKCGNEIPNDSEFCPKCGMSVIEDNSDKIEIVALSETDKQDHIYNKDRQVSYIEQFYSDEYREECKLKQKDEVIAEQRQKVNRMKTILTVSILGIFVIVAVILYFSLRQYGYTYKDDGWYISHYYGSGGDIEIPEKFIFFNVVGVDEDAFKDSKIISVKIPSNSDGKFSIRANAFSGCSNMEKIVFDRNIHYINIGENAFKDCIDLTEVYAIEQVYNSKNSYKFRKAKNPNLDNNAQTNISESSVMDKAAAVSAQFNAIEEAEALKNIKCDKTAFTNCPRFTGVE